MTRELDCQPHNSYQWRSLPQYPSKHCDCYLKSHYCCCNRFSRYQRDERYCHRNYKYIPSSTSTTNNTVKRIDKAMVEGITKPSNSTNKPKPVISVQNISSINWEKQRQTRAGVILRIKKDDDYVFLMGVDFKTGELTDLGGSISIVDRGDMRLCAARECNEETLELIDVRSQLFTSPDTLTSYSNKEMLFVVTLEVDLDKLSKEFDIRRSSLRWSEVDRLITLTKHQLCDVVNNPQSNMKMYYKTARLLTPLLSSL